MPVPWYEWRNIKEKLLIFGKAIQGVSPYKVLIEPDAKKCESGYCNFTRKEIGANPDLFDALPKDQYQLTKAILVHEAGHRRFTSPQKLSGAVHQVANILEDERIERLMADSFAGLRWLVKKLSRTLYTESEAVKKESGSPGEVIAYFLQLRFAKRVGKEVKGGLSKENKKLWEKVKPLVFEAWGADTSRVVNRNARKIVRILGIKECQIPSWVKDVQGRLGDSEGERGQEDEAERQSAGGLEPGKEKGPEDKEPLPFDGEVPPNDKREGEGSKAVEPKPYIGLEEKVEPLVKELIDELSLEKKGEKFEPQERGGRFSVREYIRDNDRPFLTEEEDKGRKAPTLALKVIVDHSTSLNHTSGEKTRIESISEAVMTLHLVCGELDVPHEVLVTPQGFKIADINSGERGKSLIAGLVPSLCGFEDMGEAIKDHAVPMADCSEDIKLVLCLTDGACNDAELGKKVCQALRGKIEVIGILLDPDERTKEYMTWMFGKDRIIACRSEELPQKLGSILRAIRGV